MIGLVVLWFTCGLACGVIAHTKGRSGAGWFVLGCIFAFFALIVIAVMPAVTPDTAQLVADKQLKRCPDCAEAVRPEANVCRFCGHRFV